jgi:beta-phosphoglucomutase-like phosphatase (HAD superfamily)
METEPAALIFDCDGTLADTMPIHFLAWQEALNPTGLVFSEDQFYGLGGMPTDKIIDLLSNEQSVKVSVDDVCEQKEQAYIRLIEQVEPIEPVVAIAREHFGKLPMGVGSGGYRDVVKSTLDIIGVRDLFQCVVGAEDTERHKPEPDVYLHVADLLQVQPEKCRVYEDTDLGIESAVRAGMSYFDVRTVHTPKRWT